MKIKEIKIIANEDIIMKSGDHAKKQDEFKRLNINKFLLVFIASYITSLSASAQRGFGGRYDLFDMDGLYSIISIFLGIILIWFVWKRVNKSMSNRKSIVLPVKIVSDTTTKDFDVRGRTKEQKKIIKYFMSTGILGMIFKISNSYFDTLLDSKAQEFASKIADRALEAHGMDVDEVKEIPPIFVEDFYNESHYCKFFRDDIFRASEYQMSYLMFSEKQVYAYSYIFDLASSDTVEQTKEYFYEDITSIDIAKTQKDILAPRPMEYIIGGIACLIIGLLLMISVQPFIMFVGFLVLIAGIYLTWFFGYSRRIVEKLILRLTVAGDEFVCAMNPENIEAIQGMKAKIREKK